MLTLFFVKDVKFKNLIPGAIKLSGQTVVI